MEETLFSFSKELRPQHEAERVLGADQAWFAQSESVAAMAAEITMADPDDVDVPHTDLEALEEGQIHNFRLIVPMWRLILERYNTGAKVVLGHQPTVSSPNPNLKNDPSIQRALKAKGAEST